MSKKLFSKVFILLLMVGLLFAVAPKQAQAQTVSTWDGTYPAVKPLDMPAVVGGVQEVTTAAQFAWLASQPTMFETGVNTVKLMVDIDLAEYPWTPSLALKGAGNILDGNYHTIQNLRVTVANTTINASYYAAMFVGNNNAVLIKNLTIDDAVIGATDTAINNRIYSAVLFSHNDWYGDLENVTVKNSSVYGTKYVAALVDYGSDTNIKNCTVQNVTITVNEKLRSGSTLRDEPHIGALIGLNNDGDVSGNTVSGLTINLTPIYEPIFLGQTGGLIGTAQAPVLVGANNVSGVTLNGTTYSTLIGLDKRTYKVVNATQMLGYTTIQAAIDAANAGDVIAVSAGTYAEDLEIGKSITLLGPNAAISPNGGVRGAEAIVAPVDQVGVADPAVLITASNISVTIKGLTFDMVDTTDQSDRFVELINKTGVTMVVEKNQFLNAPSCINGNWYITGTTSPFSLTLKDNYFTGSKDSNGIALWGNGHTVDIQDNVWTDNGGWAVNFNNVTGTFNNNQVLDTIDNGTEWYDEQAGFLFASANNLTLTNNTFDGLPNPSIRIYDSFSGTLTATDNTFSNTEDASIGVIRISDGADLTGVNFEENLFLNNPIVVQNLGTGTASLDVTPNWWGQATGPTAAQIVGIADYIPWCGEAACTTLVYPEFNGDVHGVVTDDLAGVVSGTLTGDYDLTISGQVTAYVNNRATFTGTVTGDIVGDITATINDNGVDTLSGYITNTGAILPVRILGIFPKSGIDGDFVGEIITGEVPDLADSMSITTPGDVSTVFAGGTLQFGVVIDPTTAEYGEWSIWEPTTSTGSTIDENGLLTAGTPGTLTVIVKALDGSLLDATKSITIEPALVSIAPVDPVVCGNTTTTTIDINVAGIPEATPLQGYQFRLHFDETKTSIAIPETDVVNGGFIANGGILYTYWIDGSGNISTEPTNILEVVYTQLLPSTSTGGGKLASITLTHLGVPGDIALSITDVMLSSRDGIVIPSEASATATTLTLQPAVLNTTKDPDAGYCSLAQAVEDAVDGDNLKIVADIAIPEMVTVDKELTLDLNGKTATVPVGVTALNVTSTAGDLTIDDFSTGALGEITGGNISVYVNAGAAFTLEGGSLTDALYGVYVAGTDSSVTVKDGVIDSEYFAISGNGSAGLGGTSITITGGDLISAYTGIYLPQAGTVEISGGTITAHTGIEIRSGSLNITGGEITATGAYLPDPGSYSSGSLESGDAIFVNTNPDYAGEMIIDISGGTFTSATGYALREYVDEAFTGTAVNTLTVTGGTFIGGVEEGEAGAAVTFSTQLTALQAPELALQGGLYNTDPASPTVFVFVPYATVYNTTEAMYEIVGISLNVHDFYYNNNNILRGVSTDFTVTNFVIADATSVTVELFSGSEGAYVLQQTNTLKTPASFNVSTLTSSFDIFGTYVSNSWNNSRQTEYGQHVPPTRVLVTVVLPGGTLTGENLIPDFAYSLIDPVLVAEDFAYMAQSGVRGVTAGFHPVNFTLDQVLTLKVELFAGTQLLQTNVSPVPSVHGVALLQQFSGPFDIFGSFDYETDYATGTTVYWENTRETEYGQTLVPTRVLATVTLPGGVTRTVENTLLTGDRTTILPGVNGLVTLQGILAPRAGVPVTLTSGTVVLDTFSTALSDINYGFTGVETLTYTFTTNQPRYLNVTADSGKIFLVDRDLNLTDLRLYGGDVDQNNEIQVNDASLVGQNWGSTTDPEANINYDGIVNIQDLALVGGNFGMTSATAYNWWSPLP